MKGQSSVDETESNLLKTEALIRERYANCILWMAVWRIILRAWDSARKKIWRGGVVLYRSR
jgi:hypothetical protein